MFTSSEINTLFGMTSFVVTFSSLLSMSPVAQTTMNEVDLGWKKTLNKRINNGEVFSYLPFSLLGLKGLSLSLMAVDEVGVLANHAKYLSARFLFEPNHQWWQEQQVVQGDQQLDIQSPSRSVFPVNIFVICKVHQVTMNNPLIGSSNTWHSLCHIFNLSIRSQQTPKLARH